MTDPIKPKRSESNPTRKKNRRRFSLRRLFAGRETALGKRSTFQKTIDFITLASVRSFLWKWTKSFFRFKNPAWLQKLSSIRLVPKKELKWFDYWNPIYWLVWSLGLSWRWLLTRPYLSFGPALLAMAAIFLVAGVILKKRLESTDWRSEQYKQTFVTSYAQNDFDTSRICLVSLISRHPDRLIYRFQRSLVDFELDQKDVAVQGMLSLALDKSYTDAAIWLLEKHFDVSKSESWSQQEDEQFRALVEVARSGSTGARELFVRLQSAKYSIAKGAFGDAANQFAKLAENNPEYYLLTSQLFDRLRDIPNRKKYATLARDYFQRKSVDSPNDVTTRISLAQALLLLDSEEMAARTLSEGYLVTKNEKLRQAGGEALAAWAYRLRTEQGNDTSSLIRQIGLLKKALELAPKSNQVLEVVAQLAIECADNQDSQISTMMDALVSGEGLSPESLHFIRGTVALFRGNMQEANVELDLAANGNVELPGVLNNLAVVLSKQDPPDLARALQLSQAAIARVPNHPYLMETRGQILFKMEKYKEAIPDLEFALKAQEIAQPAHESLAKAYEALGQKDLSEKHARLAAQK